MDSMTARICCSVMAHRLPRLSPAKVPLASRVRSHSPGTRSALGRLPQRVDVWDRGSVVIALDHPVTVDLGAPGLLGNFLVVVTRTQKLLPHLCCGAAGNRTRRIKRRELRKCWIRLRETTRNNLDRPADTPTVLMASTRHQHQGLVSHSLRRVRTSVDALMVTAATASAWT
jgi:hypothetical protein